MIRCFPAQRLVVLLCSGLIAVAVVSAQAFAQQSQPPQAQSEADPKSTAPPETKPPVEPKAAADAKTPPAAKTPPDVKTPSDVKMPSEAKTPSDAKSSSETKKASEGKASPTAATTAEKSPEFCLDRKFTDRLVDPPEDAKKLTAPDKIEKLIETNIGQLKVPGRASSDTIQFGSFLLPAGGRVDVGTTQTFDAKKILFGYLVLSPDDAKPLFDLRTRPATADDALVKRGKIAAGDTIVNIEIPDVDLSSSWQRASLYIFGCDGAKSSPKDVMQAQARLSPSFYSGLMTLLSVAAIYLVAAFATKAAGATGGSLSYFNPIRIAAGIDGKASLGKFQVLMFSLIVFGLLLFLLLRTGVLTEISTTLLSLMGITGVGATLARGADNQRTMLSPDNKAFLIRKHWLDPTRTTTTQAATWRDLFSTDGEFDVYRYQSFIFSLAISGALLIGGVTQLSSFEIPPTLLGILGLSQAVYIGGKLVTPTSMADLNKSLDDLRAAESKFQDAARLGNGGIAPLALTPAIVTANQSAYDEYKRLATTVRTLFKNETGIEVSPDKLEPSV